MIGDERVIFSTGCIGHGVSLTHLNGRLIADLLGVLTAWDFLEERRLHQRPTQ